MQLTHRPSFVAARTSSNLPCEQGDGKAPEPKSHRNQVLGSVVSRKLADIVSSSTHFLSCKPPS